MLFFTIQEQVVWQSLNLKSKTEEKKEKEEAVCLESMLV